MARPIITEADVMALEPGTTLSVPPDALITPAAHDRARERGIEIRRSPHPSREAIALGADHAGFALKERLKAWLIELGYEVRDFGTFDERPVDYPDIAYRVARAVSRGEIARGILLDGAGIGSCIVANKLPGVRAALCYDRATARNSREHNDANVLTLGARSLDEATAREIVLVWLTHHLTEERHRRRVEKIRDIERRHLKDVE